MLVTRGSWVCRVKGGSDRGSWEVWVRRMDLRAEMRPWICLVLRRQGPVGKSQCLDGRRLLGWLSDRHTEASPRSLRTQPMNKSDCGVCSPWFGVVVVMRGGLNEVVPG